MTKSSLATSCKRIASACVLGLALGAGSAAAAPITYEFSAEISVINSDLAAPGLSLGDAVTGSFTYETGLALSPGFNTSRQQLIDSGRVAGTDFHEGMADDVSESSQVVGGPGFGGTAPVFTISLNIGGTTYDINGDSLIRHRTNEWVLTPDRPAYAYDTLFAVSANANGGLSGIRLFDDAVFSGLFPADFTMSLLPDLNELFRARVFSVIDLDGDGVDDTQVFAAVTSLATRVPEPASWVLVLTGLLTLRRLKRAA